MPSLNKSQAISLIVEELKRTHERVEQGEFRPMRLNDAEARICILVEEIGELAELAKIESGRKSPRELKVEYETYEQFLAILREKNTEELVQIAAIALDCLTCDDPPAIPF